MRPIDLARLAGLSTQQIRHYADSGILPPTPRTPAGYRRFDARHRLALLTYRALAAGHGWHAARVIMQAVHAGDVPRALALVDAGHA
ncbi:MerR family DNA-binding transcriptional regulator, partial [Nonomuraea sp. MCN248]